MMTRAVIAAQRMLCHDSSEESNCRLLRLFENRDFSENVVSVGFVDVDYAESGDFIIGTSLAMSAYMLGWVMGRFFSYYTLGISYSRFGLACLC